MAGDRTIKILCRHPNLRDYRVPLFDHLCGKYDVHFLFSRSSEWDKKYSHTLFRVGDPSRWYDFPSLKMYITLLMRLDYEILLSSFLHSPFTVIAVYVAKLRGKKVIVWEEKWIKNRGLKARMIDVFLKLFLIPVIDAFFVCGSCQRDCLKSFGVNESRIFIANESSSDLSEIKKKEIELGVDINNKKVVLFIGRIIDWKGLDTLIEAFSLLEKKRSDLLLLIVGDGDDRMRCVELAKKLNLVNCKFIGQIDSINVKSYIFDISHVVVVPSFATAHGAEGGPIVVPEALSSGTPVVVSDAVGSANDLISNGVNGMTFKQRDSLDLADKINTILDSPDYNLMCEQARETYEAKCNYNLISKVFAECIDSVSQRCFAPETTEKLN